MDTGTKKLEMSKEYANEQDCAERLTVLKKLESSYSDSVYADKLFAEDSPDFIVHKKVTQTTDPSKNKTIWRLVERETSIPIYRCSLLKKQCLRIARGQDCASCNVPELMGPEARDKMIPKEQEE